MLRKIALITLLTASTVTLSGCSSMWSGIGSFSNYMAEKTSWSSAPGLRGAKNVETLSADVATYEAYTPISRDDAMSDYDVEIYNSDMSDTSYDTMSSTTGSEAIFDADGNYVDTSPIPCPEGTYMTAEETCMFLEQEDFSADFTQ